MARPAVPSSRKQPCGLRPRYDESPVFLFDGAVWSSLARRSWPPTEQAPQHNIPSAAANESQPPVPNTPRLSHIVARELYAGLVRLSYSPSSSLGTSLMQTNIIDASAVSYACARR